MLSKYQNIIFAGLIWLLVGIMMIVRAVSWTEILSTNQLIIVLIIGGAIGIIKFLFIFKKTVHKQIDRLMNFEKEKNYFFKIYSLKSYILIACMMTVGIVLRNLEFIPKYVLFPIYLGIGLSMLLSSYQFFNFKYRKNK